MSKLTTDVLLKESIKAILTELVNSTYDWQEYTDEEIGQIVELDPTQVAELSAVINDSVAATNKVYSSQHTKELIQESLIEGNKYADDLVANLSNIKLDIVDALPDSSTVNKSTIYILKDSTGGTNNTLNVWSDASSAFVEVGKLSVNMDNFYDKATVDTLLSGKANTDEVLKPDAIVADLTTTSGSTTLSTAGLQTELDKKANDDEVVKKADIVDNLTSTDTDKPLSANQGMLLKSMVLISGVVLPYAGSTVPTGFLLCNGQAVSRTTYQNLFDVIGTTYGDGDGSTTFNLPNLQDKFIQGAGTNVVGTKMSAGLPNITGSFVPGSVPSNHSAYATGAFQGIASTGRNVTDSVTSTNPDYGYGFNASRSNSIYGNSNTVQPPAVVMNYIIKY